jgi:hypothetical protein
MVSYKRKNKKNRRTRRRKIQFKVLVAGDQSKCLYVHLPGGGGLGNQLYVYAAAMSVKDKFGAPLCIVPSSNPHSDNNYINILFKQGRLADKVSEQTRLNSATRILKNVQLHNDWSGLDIQANATKNITIGSDSQHFQNYNAIKNVLPTIRNDCKQVFEERYPGFKDTINSNSAFMHVRRGDYGDKALVV